MAFAYTVTDRTITGIKREVWGTWTNGALDTGGAIVTGLDVIDTFDAVVTSHVGAAAPKITVSGGTLTITVDGDVDGRWKAKGV